MNAAARRKAMARVGALEFGGPVGRPIKAPVAVPVHRIMARFVLMCVGFGLIMSSFGIWLVSSQGTSDMLLMKLGVSLFMLISGMCMVVVARDGETG